MPRSLKLATDFSLPLDVAGEAIAILAKRGAGKTNTATVLVEELVSQDVQTVIIDPVGAWWGIRSSEAGDVGDGLRVPILGGSHGDVPLEHTAGALIADVVVESGSSLLVDLSDFPSKATVNRFVTDFAERLYRRKANDRSLLHLVLEEADEFAPQKATSDTARMRGAIEQIVRRGRSRGLGVTLITQRSAVLNKDVLTQTDVLVVMRTTGPQDKKAIKEWVSAKGDEQGDAVLSSLAGLATGEAWVWNPERNLLKRIKVRRRRTYDSSSTPKAGQEDMGPKSRVEIDVDSLGAKIAATAEKAKADDPKELRKRIRELEIERDKAGSVKTVEVIREVPVFNGEPEQLRSVVKEMVDCMDGFAKKIGLVGQDILMALKKEAEHAGTKPVRTDPPTQPAPRPPRERARRTTEVEAGSVTPAKQRILDALAALEAIGIEQAHKTQLALFAKTSPKSSGYANNLGNLRTAMLLDYPSPGHVALTDEGRELADPGHVPTTNDELHGYVFALVGPARARILQALIESYPIPLERGELAERAAASAASSGYANNLGNLRSLGLIDYPDRGLVVARPILFIE